MDWEKLISGKRLGMEDVHSSHRDDRSAFLRDYDRLIFSAPFRRLQNKTQVFPVHQLAFSPKALTRRAVHTFICTLVNVALVIHLSEYSLY